jgi:hypothetical protein
MAEWTYGTADWLDADWCARAWLVLLITKYMLDAGAFARGRPRVSGFKKFESSLGSQLLSA